MLKSVAIAGAISLLPLGLMVMSFRNIDNGPPAFFHVLTVLATLLTISALVDAARVPRGTWQAAGLDKTTWIVLIIVGGFVGAIAFFGWIRRRLLVGDVSQISRGPK